MYSGSRRNRRGIRSRSASAESVGKQFALLPIVHYVEPKRLLRRRNCFLTHLASPCLTHNRELSERSLPRFLDQYGIRSRGAPAARMQLATRSSRASRHTQLYDTALSRRVVRKSA